MLASFIQGKTEDKDVTCKILSIPKFHQFIFYSFLRNPSIQFFNCENMFLRDSCYKFLYLFGFSKCQGIKVQFISQCLR